jgi:hypothetical protein
VAKNLGVRASYVGNKTSHLPWYNRPINVPERQQAGAIQPRRPYQPWSDVLLLAGGGDSTIHQLQLEAIQRLSHGLNFQLRHHLPAHRPAWGRRGGDHLRAGKPAAVTT